MLRFPRWLGLALVSVACAPAVSVEGGEAGTDASTGNDTTSTSAVTSGTSAGAGPGGSSSDVETTSGTTAFDDGHPWSTSGTDDEGGNFLPRPDVGGIGWKCSVAAQNCPDGEKCVWFALEGGLRRDNAKCIPIDGDVPAFEPCSLPNGIGSDVTDDCGADSYCLEVYGTADHGFCAPFAVGGDCSSHPGTQPIFENGSDFPAACLLHPCHPLQDGACEDGMRCMFYPASLYAQAMCWVESEPTPDPLGTPCDYGSCGEGQLCASAEWLPGCDAERCCAQWCEFPGGTCDAPGTTCEFLPLWNYGADNYEDLGACLVPGVLE